MALGYASLTQPTENTKQSMFHSASGVGRYCRGTEVPLAPSRVSLALLPLLADYFQFKSRTSW